LGDSLYEILRRVYYDVVEIICAHDGASKPQPGGNAGFACGNKTKCTQMIGV
jgi:hypothetical protein